MRPLLSATLLTLAVVGRLHAQTEEVLRTAFEGRTVRLRLDMPGSSQGVDVYPGTPRPIDFPRHAGRLKDFGTAIRRGDEALVTKVKVKVKDDLIEFHLGGGGYGTFGDETSADVSVSDTPKTEREKNLERDLQGVTDPEQKRRIREELDGLRKAREREDARNQAAAAVARETKEANIRQRRLEGGSRFNLRYKPRVPVSALTPEAVRAALAEYVDGVLIRYTIASP